MIFLALWSVLVYAPICYWVWGGGFLGGLGILDLARGTVFYINSGFTALMAALIVGRQKGHGRDNLSPHDLVLTVIGTKFLWVGRFGFNAGSALAANNAAGLAVPVTQVATAGAALAWIAAEGLSNKKPSI